MKKRKIIILFLIFVVLVGFAIYYNETIREGEFIPSERSEKFYVSSGAVAPVFTREIIIDPFKVKNRERQFFSIWAKDSQGIEKVIATIVTDIGEKAIDLKLVEGTNEEGRWQGSWRTEDISIKDSYATTFKAINKENEEVEMTLIWKASHENFSWLKNFLILLENKNPSAF